MQNRSKKRTYAAIVVTIALGFLLPPAVNLKHFRVLLSESLSRSLGRQVTIEDVRLRLLPLPGFTFRRLAIADDDEFGAEPILQTAEDDGQHSVATLRLASLWRGRLEIASVSLTQASLNLVRAPDGHWNLERLINRAAQVPSAPTRNRKPELRARFPYIELTESRINFKIGPEKKPFTLSESDFALWLAAEDRWNVRLKAVPLRTDESVTDTGIIKLSGSFDRARTFAETPFHFQVSWQRADVDAIVRIVRGHDPGWRGSVDIDSEMKGTPVDFTARMNASIDEFRRYDIARPFPLDIRFNCDHRFRMQASAANAGNQLDFTCRLPLGSGVLSAEGDLHPLGKSPEYSVRLFASEVPVGSLVAAMLHGKSTLPDDLTATGVVNGDWSIQSDEGAPVKWTGTMTATDATLRSQVLESPLVLPHLVVADFELPAENTSATGAGTARKRTARKPTTVHPPSPSSITTATMSRAMIRPFFLNLGGGVQVGGVLDPMGYSLAATGEVGWQRLLQVARLIGLRPPATDLHGTGSIDLQYRGEWHHFSPPTISGQAQIQTATLSLRGFSEPFRITAGTIMVDATGFHAQKVTGALASALRFSGNFTGSRNCEDRLLCDVTFSLQSEDVNTTALRQLLSIRSSIPLPFFNSGRQFEAGWLLDVPIAGIVKIGHLAVRGFHAENVTAELHIADRKISVRQWTGNILDGKHQGEWTFDFSHNRPEITGAGSVLGARIDQLEAALGKQIGTGLVDLHYQLAMTGSTPDQLASSANGSGTFTWTKGQIETLNSGEPSLNPVSFVQWSGHFVVAKQHIALENTKMTSGSRVHQVAGNILFTREWDLKFIGENEVGAVTTSAIPRPAIASESAKVVQAK